MRDNDSHDGPLAPARYAVAGAGRAARAFAQPFEPWPYVVTLATVPVTTAVAWLLRPVAGLENVDLVYLTAIIAIAVRYGLWPSLAGSVASVLAYNFFFILPLYTFAVADPTNLAALFFFLMVAVVTSHLAARARAEAMAARDRAIRTEALYTFSRRIAGTVTLEDLATATAEQIASMLGLDVVLLLPGEQQRLQLRASSLAARALDPLDIEAVRLAWSHEAAGERRDLLRIGGRMFMPLRTSEGLVEIVGISPGSQSADPQNLALTVEEQRLLDALIDQATVALERFRLGHERDEARLAAETERLRSALLTSLSHDLKTPLASITGAVTALRQYPDLYDATARDELAGTIQEEAERLARFVANLLDMTRLEAGGIALDRQPVDVSDVIGTALQRSAVVLNDHRLEVTLEASLPMLDLDMILFEQALVNLLDNAAKFAPPGSTVTIDGRRSSQGLVISIIDEGPGLEASELERVFEKFYQAGKGDHRRAGTGLGLAICRGFVEALGGKVEANNRSDRSGAVFSVTFPEGIFAAPHEEAAE